MYRYIRAVREKKYFDSDEIIIIGSADLFRIFLAQLIPATPFPMMTIFLLGAILLKKTMKELHRFVI